MSPRDAIDELIKTGALVEWTVLNEFADERASPIRRLLMTPKAFDEVDYGSKRRSILSAKAAAFAQDACSAFVTESNSELLWPNGEVMKPLDGIHVHGLGGIGEVWELRSNHCARPHKARLFGWFPECGVFIGVVWRMRSVLGKRGSAQWEAAMAAVRKCRVEQLSLPTAFPGVPEADALKYSGL